MTYSSGEEFVQLWPNRLFYTWAHLNRSIVLLDHNEKEKNGALIKDESPDHANQRVTQPDGHNLFYKKSDSTWEGNWLPPRDFQVTLLINENTKWQTTHILYLFCHRWDCMFTITLHALHTYEFSEKLLDQFDMWMSTSYRANVTKILQAARRI